jgi:hypothetical protein
MSVYCLHTNADPSFLMLCGPSSCPTCAPCMPGFSRSVHCCVTQTFFYLQYCLIFRSTLTSFLCYCEFFQSGFSDRNCVPFFFVSVIRATRCTHLILFLFYRYNAWWVTYVFDGFGGLVVSMLASGTRVRGVQSRPKPLDFSGVVKILKHAFLRRVSKICVPCPQLCGM